MIVLKFLDGDIKMTKKYAAVYGPLIERLHAEAEKGHKKSLDSIKAVKTKLHQMYGAYTQDNAHKKAAAIISKHDDACTSSNDLSDCNKSSELLLSLHASTKERLPYYPEFYEFILSRIGPVESVLDIGCGYNPFSIPVMQAVCEKLFHTGHAPTAHAGSMAPAVNLKAYYAYDIDTRVADLINRYFSCLSLPPLAECADLAVHIPAHQADLALMCKLIPVLEAQAPGSGYKLARELNVRYLLVTYPLKSLSGREKGMAKHYAATFEKAMADGEFGKFSIVGHGVVGTEILYLLAANQTNPSLVSIPHTSPLVR